MFHHKQNKFLHTNGMKIWKKKKMMFSSSIQLAANDKFHSFLWLSKILLYINAIFLNLFPSSGASWLFP
jgi:hypothetical protein